MSKKQIILTVSLLLVTLAVAAFFHGYNMFAYPYFESDEGTYVSQAWAVVEMGQLSPYTYWYDHPPGGWLFIAFFTLFFERGFFAFGSSLETGRAFMLVLHILSAGLVFFIVRYFTGSFVQNLNGYKSSVANLPWAAFGASVIFSISPLAIYFQRRVLLDNMMVFWFLASLGALCLAHRNLRLHHYMLSGLFFAFALLTKLTVVFFAPAMLYLLWTHRSPVARHFRLVIWMMISGMVFSVYFLYALLKDEFFAASSGEHVSFMEALTFQATREGGSFREATSDFARSFAEWGNLDPLVFPLALGLVLVGIVMTPFFRNVRFFVLALIPYLYFLMSGGVNFNFYIIPLLPLVAMSVGVFTHNVLSAYDGLGHIFGKFTAHLFYAITVICLLLTCGLYYASEREYRVFTVDETRNQLAITQWIKENLDEDTPMLIDNYNYVDLHDPGYINQKVFAKAEWYYKVSRDSAVGQARYDMDWRNFDYITLSHEMVQQIAQGDDAIISEAFAHAYPYKKWTDERSAFLDIPKLISTNGDWSMLYRIGDSDYELLSSAWERYKRDNLVSYGQLVDPVTGITTAQMQAQAMLQAVMMDDEDTFKGVWSWTQDHLQSRVQDALFSVQWRSGQVSEGNNNTGVDADIALALLQAAHMWEKPGYEREARIIINSIWNSAVVDVAGRLYVLGTDEVEARRYEDKYLIALHSLSPAHYRVFGSIDTGHDWLGLAGNSYDLLNTSLAVPWNPAGLPQSHIMIDQFTAELSSPESYVGTSALEFNTQSSGVLWRTAMDAQWFASQEAVALQRAIVENLSTSREAYLSTEGFDGLATEVQAGIISALATLAETEEFATTDIGEITQGFSQRSIGVELRADSSANATSLITAWKTYALKHGNFVNVLDWEYHPDRSVR